MRPALSIMAACLTSDKCSDDVLFARAMGHDLVDRAVSAQGASLQVVRSTASTALQSVTCRHAHSRFICQMGREGLPDCVGAE